MRWVLLLRPASSEGAWLDWKAGSSSHRIYYHWEIVMIRELVITKTEGNQVTLRFYGLLSPFACKLALARTNLSGFYDATGCMIVIDIIENDVAEVARCFYETYLKASQECKGILTLQRLIRDTYKQSIKWYSGASSKPWC